PGQGSGEFYGAGGAGAEWAEADNAGRGDSRPERSCMAPAPLVPLAGDAISRRSAARVAPRPLGELPASPARPPCPGPFSTRLREWGCRAAPIRCGGELPYRRTRRLPPNPPW